jgi:hypothetical protein
MAGSPRSTVCPAIPDTVATQSRAVVFCRTRGVVEMGLMNTLRIQLGTSPLSRCSSECTVRWTSVSWAARQHTASRNTAGCDLRAPDSKGVVAPAGTVFRSQ